MLPLVQRFTLSHPLAYITISDASLKGLASELSVQPHIQVTHRPSKAALPLVLHTCMLEPSMVVNVGVPTPLVRDLYLPQIVIVP